LERIAFEAPLWTPPQDINRSVIQSSAEFTRNYVPPDYLTVSNAPMTGRPNSAVSAGWPALGGASIVPSPRPCPMASVCFCSRSIKAIPMNSLP
jgi:hypothetical protein